MTILERLVLSWSNSRSRDQVAGRRSGGVVAGNRSKDVVERRSGGAAGNGVGWSHGLILMSPSVHNPSKLCLPNFLNDLARDLAYRRGDYSSHSYSYVLS